MTHFDCVGHVEHFCYRHAWPTGNGLAVTCDFHFRDIKMTHYKVIQGHGHCGFRILGVKILSVFRSNHGSISHRLGAMDAESFQYTDDTQQTTDRHASSDKSEAANGVALIIIIGIYNLFCLYESLSESG